MATVPYSADLAAPESDKDGGSSRLILWLVVAGLGILFLPLFLISTTIKADNLALDAQVSEIQATLSSTAKPQQSDQTLKDKLAQLQKQASALETLQPTLVAGHIDWPTTMNAIAIYNTAQITLTGLSQTDTRLVVNGQAESEDSVMAYAAALRDSERFKRVIVQSITLKSPPTAIPSGMRAGVTDGKAKPAEFTISLDLVTGSSTPGAR